MCIRIVSIGYNADTQYITEQFLIIFDHLLQTVITADRCCLLEKRWIMSRETGCMRPAKSLKQTKAARAVPKQTEPSESQK